MSGSFANIQIKKKHSYHMSTYQQNLSRVKLLTNLKTSLTVSLLARQMSLVIVASSTKISTKFEVKKLSWHNNARKQPLLEKPK